MDYYSALKKKREMSYQAMKRHGGTLNAHCYVKGAHLNRRYEPNHMIFWKRQHCGDSEETEG